MLALCNYTRSRNSNNSGIINCIQSYLGKHSGINPFILFIKIKDNFLCSAVLIKDRRNLNNRCFKNFIFIGIKDYLSLKALPDVCNITFNNLNLKLKVRHITNCSNYTLSAYLSTCLNNTCNNGSAYRSKNLAVGIISTGFTRIDFRNYITFLYNTSKANKILVNLSANVRKNRNTAFAFNFSVGINIIMEDSLLCFLSLYSNHCFCSPHWTTLATSHTFPRWSTLHTRHLTFTGRSFFYVDESYSNCCNT